VKEIPRGVLAGLGRIPSKHDLVDTPRASKRFGGRSRCLWVWARSSAVQLPKGQPPALLRLGVAPAIFYIFAIDPWLGSARTFGR